MGQVEDIEKAQVLCELEVGLAVVGASALEEYPELEEDPALEEEYAWVVEQSLTVAQAWVVQPVADKTLEAECLEGLCTHFESLMRSCVAHGMHVNPCMRN